MKVSLFQYDIKWLDKKYNLEILHEEIKSNSEMPDLYILPEMFLTGFCMDANKSSITEDDFLISALIQICKEYDTHIIGSLAIKEEDKFYNRVLFIGATGILARYDKKHLYTPSGEREQFSTKHKAKLFKFKEWTILTQVCYDLRFPESVRQLEAPDVLIYTANWPDARIMHWNTLLRARAIENQCYTIGVNRLGKDGNGWTFPGQSQFIEPNGTHVSMHENSKSMTIELERDKVRRYREKYRFLEDKDPFY